MAFVGLSQCNGNLTVFFMKYIHYQWGKFLQLLQLSFTAS